MSQGEGKDDVIEAKTAQEMLSKLEEEALVSLKVRDQFPDEPMRWIDVEGNIYSRLEGLAEAVVDEGPRLHVNRNLQIIASLVEHHNPDISAAAAKLVGEVLIHKERDEEDGPSPYLNMLAALQIWGVTSEYETLTAIVIALTQTFDESRPSSEISDGLPETLIHILHGREIDRLTAATINCLSVLLLTKTFLIKEWAEKNGSLESILRWLVQERRVKGAAAKEAVEAMWSLALELMEFCPEDRMAEIVADKSLADYCIRILDTRSIGVEGAARCLSILISLNPAALGDPKEAAESIVRNLYATDLPRGTDYESVHLALITVINHVLCFGSEEDVNCFTASFLKDKGAALRFLAGAISRLNDCVTSVDDPEIPLPTLYVQQIDQGLPFLDQLIDLIFQLLICGNELLCRALFAFLSEVKVEPLRHFAFWVEERIRHEFGGVSPNLGDEKPGSMAEEQRSRLIYFLGTWDSFFSSSLQDQYVKLCSDRNEDQVKVRFGETHRE